MAPWHGSSLPLSSGKCTRLWNWYTLSQDQNQSVVHFLKSFYKFSNRAESMYQITYIIACKMMVTSDPKTSSNSSSCLWHRNIKSMPLMSWGPRPFRFGVSLTYWIPLLGTGPLLKFNGIVYWYRYSGPLYFWPILLVAVSNVLNYQKKAQSKYLLAAETGPQRSFDFSDW